MCSFSGAAAVNFIKQYHAFGLKMPLLCQGNTTDESTLEETGPDAVGVTTALQYSAALKTPANEAFVAAYTKAYGHVPSYYAEGTYVGGEYLDHALAATKGNTSDALAFVKALRAVNAEAPRGPFRLDDRGNPQQSIYIRRVESQNGRLVNAVIKTYPNVSQFWTYDPKEYLSKPAYSRTYPVCNACGG